MSGAGLQEIARSELAARVQEVRTLVVLARTLLGRVGRLNSDWDIVAEDLANAIESLEDLQAAISAGATGAAKVCTLAELVGEIFEGPGH